MRVLRGIPLTPISGNCNTAKAILLKESKTLLKKPKISCHYGTPLCKEFFNRILDK